MNSDDNTIKNRPPKPPVMPTVKKTKDVKGIIKKTIIITLSIIALFLIIVNMCFRIPVKDYLSNSKNVFKIPQINDGYIGQGVYYDRASGDFYLTGYMKDGSASPIYIIDGQTKKLVKTVKMADDKGNPYAGHSGGIALYNGKVYVTNVENDDFSLLVFDPSDIRSAEDNQLVSYINKISLSDANDFITPCFLTVDEDHLIIGEFYRDNNFLTSMNHKIEHNKGVYNALAVAVDIVDDTVIPIYAYSIDDCIQGMCIDNNKIYLSSSYGLAFSHIYTYEKPKNFYTFRMILGKDIPIYLLNEDKLISDKKISPMSEEIDIVSDKMYIMTEAASDKYIFGKLIGLNKIKETSIDLFNN